MNIVRREEGLIPPNSIPFTEDYLSSVGLAEPEERWTEHIRRVICLFRAGRALRNIGYWQVGEIYRRLQDEPETYSGEGQPSQRTLASELGWSAASVNNAARVRRCYELDEIKALSTLPTKVLIQAALIPNPCRDKMLCDFMNKQAARKIKAGEMLKQVEEARAEQQRIPDTSGVPEQPAAETDDPEAPPVGKLENMAQNLIVLLMDLAEAIDTQRIFCADSEVGTIRTVLYHVQEQCGRVKESMANQPWGKASTGIAEVAQ